MKIASAVLIVAALSATQAQAQNWRMLDSSGAKGMRVTANFQLSAPTQATASAGELTRTMAAVSQSLYEIVDRQCDVLGAALKGDCRLVQINVGSNINDRMNNGVPFVNANANATFEIDVKAPPTDAAPQ
jgi:hypothetical protein